jgi:hypothetical protein
VVGELAVVVVFVGVVGGVVEAEGGVVLVVCFYNVGLPVLVVCCSYSCVAYLVSVHFVVGCVEVVLVGVVGVDFVVLVDVVGVGVVGVDVVEVDVVVVVGNVVVCNVSYR